MCLRLQNPFTVALVRYWQGAGLDTRQSPVFRGTFCLSPFNIVFSSHCLIFTTMIFMVRQGRLLFPKVCSVKRWPRMEVVLGSNSLGCLGISKGNFSQSPPGPARPQCFWSNSGRNSISGRAVTRMLLGPTGDPSRSPLAPGWVRWPPLGSHGPCTSSSRIVCCALRLPV